jgi:hypothetical protein
MEMLKMVYWKRKFWVGNSSTSEIMTQGDVEELEDNMRTLTL